MAWINSKLFFTSLMILVALIGVGVGGTVHKVGDSSGWTMMGVDYQAWASSRTFQVGDSLVFEYNNEFHDVTEVTPHDFELCYSSNPLARYQTGSDTVTLTKPGFQHFILAYVTTSGAWWFNALILFTNTTCGGCPLTWTSFSIEAFTGLWEFGKLSLSSES
ncbi:PREDICTED: mavicyanin-like [Brassica oleracea var. oleracea]|uniref:mavicyanin-like n=1 Tax=Brassica oleracea var. oleracea TaxID=109376 RepID=UPI0006A6D7C6|nr:PREDICTED: mavicyanin-like [Brassica oleracea var. oleracea]